MASDNINFIDRINIFARSGKGGNGFVHFMRTKQNPKAGPDGGDGGRGGHIILQGNKNLWTLLHLRYHKNVLAPDGGRGRENNAHGKNGDDIIIEVPLGTVAKNADTGAVEAEILHDGERVIWLHGGRGGRGNAFFKKSTLQTPDFAQEGEAAEEGNKIVELKLLADVGLVGFPNAGKSTLLSVISAARPKIANYPFTTLTPKLGIVGHGTQQSFCVADLPGLIAGAAEGRGLGHRFLRHIERNSVLLFVIAADTENICEQYQTLLSELKNYNADLLDKPRLLAISKIDLLAGVEQKIDDLILPEEVKIIYFSAHTGEGISDLKHLLWRHIIK